MVAGFEREDKILKCKSQRTPKYLFWVRAEWCHHKPQLESQEKQVGVKENEFSSRHTRFEEATGYPDGGKEVKWGFGTRQKDWELEVHLQRIHCYIVSYYGLNLHRKKKED